jgi:hypothetical protein
MRQPLKQTVRDKFAEVDLDSRQLDELETLLQGAGGQRRPLWRHPAMAAAIVLLAIGSLFSIQQYESYQAAGLLESIAIEVADNHLKLKPLEIESTDLRSVLGYFEDLEFQLQASPRITGKPGDRLLGGRYCTIRGIDAAQLRVVASDGVLSTWYEASLPAEQLRLVPAMGDGEHPAAFVIRGVDIRIWQEHGVVFAEAKEAAGRR